MNLAIAFAESAQRHAPKKALFWGDAEYSYEQLHRQTMAVTTHLATALTVKPGDRVGLLLRNCPEFIPAFFGVLNVGAVVVPINSFLKPEEISFILKDAGIDVLITENAYAEMLPKLAEARPGLRSLQVELISTLAEPGTGGFHPANRTAEDLAVLIYTSGTTGRPKGAMLTNGNLLHNVASCREVLAAIDHDRFVLLLPMFHSFMLCVCILLPLLVGGSVVLIKSLHPPKNIFLEILAHQPTILPAIPQFFRTLLDIPNAAALPLRLCISGAAPLPGQVLAEFSRKFPFPLLEGYGLSEASPVVSMNPLQGPWKAGSIGIPIPNVEVSVQNEAGDHLPAGQVGEICVRGGNVMCGYWNQPEATAETLKNGWLLTGDIGHQDADGYLYITDRKKDMLLVNGINVYPREIEEIMYQFPGVKEAAVVGQPDARRGEQPVAFLVLVDGMTVDETKLLGFLRERLADYKVPRRVLVLPALPRNAAGKILKTTLRAMNPARPSG